MAPFFGEKSLSKGGWKNTPPRYTSAEKSPGTNRVKLHQHNVPQKITFFMKIYDSENKNIV